MPSDDFAKRRVGQVLDGRYELTELLGVGMTGAVYAARHRYTHRDVAVKVMHPQLLGDRRAAARFLREAREVNEVGHPAVVEVIDAGETKEHWPYVVLELLEGQSLGSILRETGPLPADRVVAIGLDLLDGLAAAHAHGIVHRDIKPDNLFVLDPPAESTVKILDFGVAKNLRSAGSSGLAEPGATVGTPSFMSPEQARAQPVDERTDLWSAGAVLFRAVTGRAPFQERTVPTLLLKLVTGTPPRVGDVAPEVPGALQRAIDGALISDRDERWQTAAEMAAALRG
jgi:serine/threonine protein kinase